MIAMKPRFLFLSGIIFVFLTGCASTHKKPVNPKTASMPRSATLVETSTPVIDISSTLPSFPAEEPDTTELPPLPEKKVLSMEEQERLVNQFLEGAIFEERSQFDEAGKAYAKALELAPSSPYLGAMTGKAMLQSGQADEAIRIAQDAIKNGTNEQEIYKVLGNAFRQKKEFDKALEQYQKLLVLQPDSLDVLNDLVSLYVRTQRYEEAIDTYRKMAKLDIYQSFMYQFRIALILTQLGRFEEALEEYKSVAKQIPNNFDVYSRIGKLQEALDHPDEAIVAYLTALQYNRNTQEEIGIRNALGLLYYNRKSYQEAIYQFSRLKELLPDDPQIPYQTALIQFDQGKYPEALQEVNGITQKFPENFFYQTLRLKILEKLDRGAEGYQGFLHGLGSAMEKNSWDDTESFLVELTRKVRIQRLQEYKQLSTMQQLLEKSIQKFPDHPRTLFIAAKIALVRNQPDEATQFLEKILSELDKNRTIKNGEGLDDLLFEFRYWYEVRRALSSTPFTEKTLSVLHNCQTEFPDNPDIPRTLASIYMDSFRWQEAETQLISAKSKMRNDDPSFKDVLFQLATIYDKMDRLSDVELVMREAIQNFPDDSQGYNFLGYTYADRNVRLEDALQLIQKALTMDPDDGNILDSMGWAYYRMGKIDDAVEFLEKAAIQEENHPVILEHLGDALYLQGKMDDAIRCWKKALEFGPESPYDFTPLFQERVIRKIQEVEKKPLP